MKTAIVFFSRTQTTEKIAKQIAKELGGDLLRVRADLYPTTIRGYIRALRHAFSQTKPTIETGNWNLDKYDLVIVGTPVWGGRMSAPIRSFLTQHRYELKNVAYFATCGGRGADEVIRKMTALTQNEPISTMKITAADFKNSSYKKRVADFVEEIRHGKSRAAAPTLILQT